MMDWQPAETAPLWELVLVFQDCSYKTKSCKDGVFCAVQVEPGMWTLTNNGRTRTVGMEKMLDPAPTHWMPRPTPPVLLS